MKSVALAVALALLCARAGVARAESDDGDHWFAADKAAHFAASAALGCGGYGLGALVWDGRGARVGAGLTLSLALGVGKELYDLSGEGDPSLKDLTWDVLGALVGVAAAWAIDRLTAVRDEGEAENSSAASRVAGGAGLFVLTW